MAAITVVIPTVRGREDHYERCVEAYRTRSAGHAIHLVTVRDMDTCGLAWNAGAAQAAEQPPDYLHFTADDLEPHWGWDVAAIEAVKANKLPAPRIVNPAGHLDYCGEHQTELPDWQRVQMSVIPFMSWAQWQKIGPALDCHYFTDNHLSWRGLRAGYETVVRRGYEFTHHWAQARRGAGMTVEQRMAHDRDVFNAAMRPKAVAS